MPSAGKSNKGAKRKYLSRTIPYSRNCKGNGYKLSAKRFVGSFGWTSVSHDWLMAALRTMTIRNQPLSTQTIPEIVATKLVPTPHIISVVGNDDALSVWFKPFGRFFFTITKGWTIRKVRGWGCWKGFC